jgi:glycine amidinotransferase
MGKVSSYTEFQPLEEVIVGSPAGAFVPAWTRIEDVTVPPGSEDVDSILGAPGTPFDPGLIEAAEACLAEFLEILAAAGATIRRPDPIDAAAGYATPAWSVPSGMSAANPRDVLLVVGDELIEVPMPDRGRYFEIWPYRTLLKEYHRAGARWVAAPKPQLLDPLYRPGYRAPGQDEPVEWILTDFEPVFDAADALRCGRDLFIEQSQVTNAAGIEWLRRHLGPSYRVHEIRPRYRRQMHIDTSLVLLAPGKALVNPEFLDPAELPDALRTWDVRLAPEPVVTEKTARGVMSKWSGLNMFSLDERHVVVERQQTTLIKELADWGFEPVPCSFEDYTLFGGSFHCATLDVRRRGGWESYFD